MDVRIVESVHDVFAVGASRMRAVVLWGSVQLNRCPVMSRFFDRLLPSTNTLR